MSSCMSMSIKRRSRGRKSAKRSRRLNPALVKQSRMVKKLAAEYRSRGKKIVIGKLAKEAAKMVRQGKSVSPRKTKRRSSGKSRKTKRRSRR